MLITPPLYNTRAMLALDDVAILHLATVHYPDWHPLAGTSGPLLAFAIRHPDGVILIDSGLGPPHPFIDRHYRPERASLPDALAAAGIGIGDVAAIVTTHLHFDHCGGNSAFPGVSIHVQRAEREAAGAENYTIPEFVDFPGAEYVLLDGDAEIAPGVTAIATAGHTPGHQAVRIATRDGLVVIGGQAADNAGELTQEAIGALPDGPVRTARQRLVEGGPARIYLSHDTTVIGAA